MRAIMSREHVGGSDRGMVTVPNGGSKEGKKFRTDGGGGLVFSCNRVEYQIDSKLR